MCQRVMGHLLWAENQVRQRKPQRQRLLRRLPKPKKRQYKVAAMVRQGEPDK